MDGRALRGHADGGGADLDRRAGRPRLGPGVRHRPHAGQGAEDRLRPAARVRAQHDRHPGAHQEAGRGLMPAMRTATTVEASGGGRWREQADFVTEAERLGLDVCWVAEAWGSDAPSAIGYY